MNATHSHTHRHTQRNDPPTVYQDAAADLCMGTCAGRDRALQESSLWGDTERERCWTARCCSGTARVLPRSLSLELRSAPTHTHTHVEHEYTHAHRVWKAETQKHVSSCVHRVLLTTDAIVLQTVEHHGGMFYRLMTSQWTGLLVMSAVPSSWLFLQCHIWDRTQTVSPASCQMTWRIPNNQWKGLWMQQYRKQMLHFTTKPVQARLPRHM